MTSLVSWLSPAFLQCEELIAQIDEGRSLALPAKLEIEQSAIESESVVYVANFQGYVVQTNRAGFSCFTHTTLHQVMRDPISPAQVLRAAWRVD
jgi:hypothetical protein